MTDSAITKKSKRSIWIPLLVLITLAACATAGYSYWRMQQEPSTAAAKAEPQRLLPMTVSKSWSTPLNRRWRPRW